jgi:Family of unknown function (DUF6445)
MRFLTEKINLNYNKRLWIVDNFYEDPYSIRNYALQQDYEDQSEWYKGRRTVEQHFVSGTKKAFEDIMGVSITNWSTHGMCGRFQFCTPQDSIVYHWDSQTWAAMIYLTPDAPYQCGTSFYAHKKTRARHQLDQNSNLSFEGGYFDKTKFELVDTVGNVFNRLFIFDARSIHAASEYFGQTIEDSRLFHIFFFD